MRWSKTRESIKPKPAPIKTRQHIKYNKFDLYGVTGWYNAHRVTHGCNKRRMTQKGKTPAKRKTHELSKPPMPNVQKKNFECFCHLIRNNLQGAVSNWIELSTTSSRLLRQRTFSVYCVPKRESRFYVSVKSILEHSEHRFVTVDRKGYILGINKTHKRDAFLHLDSQWRLVRLNRARWRIRQWEKAIFVHV